MFKFTDTWFFVLGGHFIPKKQLILVFYDNRNLKISKSKKSEQYFRDKIEIFIRLFDENFVRHFESYWRETWRLTGRQTVPQISLETPLPPPPPLDLKKAFDTDANQLIKN